MVFRVGFVFVLLVARVYATTTAEVYFVRVCAFYFIHTSVYGVSSRRRFPLRPAKTGARHPVYGGCLAVSNQYPRSSGAWSEKATILKT